MEWTQEEKEAAQEILGDKCNLHRGIPMPLGIELQCEVTALREALQYMYDSARELSCECFELGALQQAKETLARIPQ